MRAKFFAVCDGLQPFFVIPSRGSFVSQLQVEIHYHVSEINFKGIGICLVDNLSKENVSEKPIDILIYYSMNGFFAYSV